MKPTHVNPRVPVEDRLHAKLVPNPNGCIEFVGARLPRGYGVIGDFRDGLNKMALTHRLAWEMIHGPIPKGMNVCHSCDNPPCCNPEHLWLGTTRENALDMTRKGRQWGQKRTHCPKGHPYDEANTFVDRKGHRFCRTCRNDTGRRLYWAKKGLPDPRALKSPAA